MAKHDVHTIEDDGFTARIHFDDNSWHAKIRLEDDGQRGKNLSLNTGTAQALADQLTALAAAFTATANKVTELANPQSDGGGPVTEAPAWS